jgi:hypothetical protein
VLVVELGALALLQQACVVRGEPSGALGRGACTVALVLVARRCRVAAAWRCERGGGW